MAVVPPQSEPSRPGSLRGIYIIRKACSSISVRSHSLGPTYSINFLISMVQRQLDRRQGYIGCRVKQIDQADMGRNLRKRYDDAETYTKG
jgi:hypothetical protein